MPVLERADDETAAEMPRFLRLWRASCFSSFAPARVSLRIIRCLSGAGRRLRCCVSAHTGFSVALPQRAAECQAAFIPLFAGVSLQGNRCRRER